MSKKDYATWQEIQQEFPDYKASLGPWIDAAVVEYLDEEYVDIFPNANKQIAEFLKSESKAAVVRFAKQVPSSKSATGQNSTPMPTPKNLNLLG
ncbi:hypothetical protein [Duganella sp. FT27W]|uniref:hypothetical protein n=1 Tax=Duganella sp. FT27W TaxID=2654636 RepID=UPI00186B6948|nr:hypothetical protein [Duganella sp. FT27W]